MTGLHLTNMAGLWALLGAIPIVLLHVLRPRRPQADVSSTLLWRAVEQPISAARPWQRLRWSALLLLQLLAVALLALALAKPARSTAAPLSAHTVFVLDASGSMAAKDGRPDRLAAARSRARQLRGQLPSGGVASIVVGSIEPQVLLTASSDRRAFDAALDRVKPIAGTARWEDTFNLAASLETPGKPISLLLLSDGGLTSTEQRLIPAGTAYVKIGSRSVNRGFTAFTVEPRPGGLRARFTVRNTGGPRARQTVRVDVDGRTRARVQVNPATGKSVDGSVDLPAGDQVEAFLDGDDLLNLDDHAYAVGARRRPLRVLHAGADDPLLDELLASLPGLTVVRAATSRPAPGFDLVIYNQVPIPVEPGAPFLAIAPPGGMRAVSTTEEVIEPALTLVAEDPLLSGLDLSEVAIAQAQRLTLGTGDIDVLVGSDTTPLLLRGTHEGRAFAYLGFVLADSNLPLQVAFPLLGDRLVNDLAGAAPGTTQVLVGQPLPVDVSQTVNVRAPASSSNVRRPAGAAPPLADRPGFWTIRQPGRPDRLVAVNADPSESKLAPLERLPIAQRPLTKGERRPAGERSVLSWIVGALLLVLAAEWLVARRRIGVPRGQWRAGALARVLMCALLIGALINPSVHRKGRSTSVLFLVDTSDSLGLAGRREALEFVREALAAAPSSAKAGVTLFGGDARVESLVAKGVDLGTPTVQIDRSRTNAAGALRLAPALLPPSDRRRVVLISDGRFTDGDATIEAQRLADEGIPVDVHVVRPAAGSDVAVTQVDVPGRVARGDKFTVRGVVRAESAGDAVVHVRRDAGNGRETEVETRTVSLVAGDNVIDVPQTAGESGVVRYRVVVAAPNDGVRDNDAGFGATQVDGPPKVLVVEGARGAAATLTAALRAGGVQSETIDPGSLPAVEKLAEYRAVVLVDVEANSLAKSQIDALGAATRELGRGLVIVGGEHSFALGGYRDTDLEDLLPVESEIRDPLRRKSVAQVLAIDTSGSMGTCHCASGSGGGFSNRAEGGVNKTDLSRTAAAQSIATMAADDQIGVLAFNTQHKWILELQKVPPEDAINAGLRTLAPRGNTDLSTPLLDAGTALRKAKANLKHIVLFTDGFTSTGSLAGLAGQAADLAGEGITVSVVGTGEGSAEELKAVADAGRGRFYPGTDLLQIPQIMVQETVLASRSFINEGEFVPSIVSVAAPVRDLESVPPLLGYVATTAKPAAETWLRIGPERDPLLASWRVGLGRVTAWTSDASARWSQGWAAWDGYSPFWSTLVKHAFPISEGASLRAEVRNDRMRVVVEGDAAWPDGSTGSVRVAGPDGLARLVPLERTGTGQLAADLDAPLPGTYAVGAEVRGANGRTLATTSALATRSYAAEYLPGPVDLRGMQRLSERTGGRGSIAAAEAFAADGLTAGRALWRLGGWMLLAAVLLWPLDVALRRLVMRRRTVAGVIVPRRTAVEERARSAITAVRARLDVEKASEAVEAPATGTLRAVAGTRRQRRTAAPDTPSIGESGSPVSGSPVSGSPVSGSPVSGSTGVSRGRSPGTDSPETGSIGASPGSRASPSPSTAAADSSPKARDRGKEGASARLDRLVAAKRARAASPPEPVPGQEDGSSADT